MMWGYTIGGGGKLPSPFELNIESHCHALITGSSGSGKSYALLYLLGCLLQNEPNTIIFFCDFKNSKDFSFLNEYLYYFSGNGCYDGIMEYYKHFCESRINGNINKRYLLIFDEYPSFIAYYTGKDKQEKTKKASDVLNVISEILMLGRGIQYGIWIVTQRADSSLFANGSRDNFMIILGLGRMSKEQKGMVFSGEDIPEKIYHQGEGILLADGYPLQEIVIPKIRNIVDWKKHIKEILMKQNNN